jgi:hypothetical protein
MDSLPRILECHITFNENLRLTDTVVDWDIDPTIAASAIGLKSIYLKFFCPLNSVATSFSNIYNQTLDSTLRGECLLKKQAP